jgi:hypothetical protein
VPLKLSWDLTRLSARGSRQTAALAACGGGGSSNGGNSPPAQPPPPVAQAAPLFQSPPPELAVVGKRMQYQASVQSSSPSSVSFAISNPPSGMSIGSSSGLLIWTPTAAQQGDQSVTINATDENGQTSQSFTLSVFGTQVVASSPISAANGGTITVSNSTSRIYGLSIRIPARAVASDPPNRYPCTKPVESGRLILDLLPSLFGHRWKLVHVLEEKSERPDLLVGQGTLP